MYLAIFCYHIFAHLDAHIHPVHAHMKKLDRIKDLIYVFRGLLCSETFRCGLEYLVYQNILQLRLIPLTIFYLRSILSLSHFRGVWCIAAGNIPVFRLISTELIDVIVHSLKNMAVFAS